MGLGGVDGRNLDTGGDGDGGSRWAEARRGLAAAVMLPATGRVT